MPERIIDGVGEGSYNLELSAVGENLERIRNFIAGIAGEMGFDRQHINQIELIVDEACSNVIQHAYKNGNCREKTIRVSVKKHPGKIEIAIADRGDGFDPAAVKSPNLEEYQKKMIVGGLGLYLIKKFSDEVQFNIRPGVRNEVRMVKFL